MPARYRNALVNTLSVGAVAGLFGGILGYVAAFVPGRTKVPGTRLLHMPTILPIVSPPFSGAISILFLFGFNDLITRQLLR